MQKYLARYHVREVESFNRSSFSNRDSYFGVGYQLKSSPRVVEYEFQAKNTSKAIKLAEKHIKVLIDSAQNPFSDTIKIPKPTLERLLQIREIKLR